MMTQEQIDRMVKDANFVGPKHPYAESLFNDLCCHVRALAAEVDELKTKVADLENGLAATQQINIDLHAEVKARMEILDEIATVLPVMFADCLVGLADAAIVKQGVYTIIHLAAAVKKLSDYAREKRRCLDEIASIIETVDNRCSVGDGPVTPTLSEMTQAEISEIYALAKGNS